MKCLMVMWYVKSYGHVVCKVIWPCGMQSRMVTWYAKRTPAVLTIHTRTILQAEDPVDDNQRDGVTL